MNTITRERIQSLAEQLANCRYADPREVQELARIALTGMEADKLPSQGSNEVNEAAWILHDQLTKLGPLNGHQFNNLKGCFYEALKVAMRNSPVMPDWLAEAEKMAELRGSSFVLFRSGESPQCADPSKVVISFADEGHTWSPGLIHPENCQCDEHRSAMLQGGK